MRIYSLVKIGGKMDIYKARQELKTKRIQDLSMRVVHYDRVSTDKEEQKNSIANQNYFSETVIRENPNWIYAGRYVDDAVTGLSTEKRIGFMQMISDAKQGKFDFIITKEVPRFARNTLDSIEYSRKLLQYGVGIWFVNNNIITISDDSEFLLTIMAGMAQEESRRISSRVKFGHRQSIKRGHVLGANNMYGYIKKDCKLVIDEESAKMVRFIFQKYATGCSSTNKLEAELYSLGYRNKNGGKINATTIQHILTNPKYKGYYCGGKVTVEDMFTKKQHFIDEEDWILYKDLTGKQVPAIVDEETWNMANTILNKRREKFCLEDRESSYKQDNLFTGKIICQNCGNKYWMRARGKKGKNQYDRNWECSKRKKEGTAACDSFSIKESELVDILSEVINASTASYQQILDEYLEMLKLQYQEDAAIETKEALTKELKQIRKKRDKLLDHNLNDRISDEDFYERDQVFKKQEIKIKSELDCMENSNSQNQFHQLEQKIRNHAEKLKKITPDMIDQETINLFVDKIYAKKIGESQMKLTFKLNTGVDFQTVYEKKHDHGQMCRSLYDTKKMIEEQEKQMSNK